MSIPMRAKMKINCIFKHEASEYSSASETVHFSGVSKNDSYPEDGSDEDNTFAKFSPAVNLQMTIANPALLGKYKQGDIFYVDFTPIQF